MTDNDRKTLIEMSKNSISKLITELNDELKGVELYSSQPEDTLANCENRILEINNHISKLKSALRKPLV